MHEARFDLGVGLEDRKGWRETGLANGGLSAVTANDEPYENQNTERASEDIGNVADRTSKANAWDTTLWVDPYRGGWCVGRGADKKSGCIVLKLFLMGKWGA
jgi:hypothetical protein